MARERVDIAIVGGGLAGGLTALAIAKAHPNLQIALFEAGGTFGGNHRWSWFPSDLSEPAAGLLDEFPQASWDGGYDVSFPKYTRTLRNSYRSIVSNDFDAVLRRKLPQSAIRTGNRIEELSASHLTLSNSEVIEAGTVIDTRDFAPSEHLSGGWQVFLGQRINTQKPHGQTRPIIMDANVTQHGAYRFVYSLPLSDDEIFVEDTYYADTPQLDRDQLAQRTADYAEARGWSGDVIHEETGVLPVVTDGDFDAHRARFVIDGVVLAGARGLFTHPLTSYTLPIATQNAVWLAENAHRPAAELAKLCEARARDHWQTTAHYRALGRMLFDAAKPDQRYRIFERFYTLREPLITRFYAAQPTSCDKFRVLCGRPPVSVGRAIAALLGKGTPLVQRNGNTAHNRPKETQ